MFSSYSFVRSPWRDIFKFCLFFKFVNIEIYQINRERSVLYGVLGFWGFEFLRFG